MKLRLLLLAVLAVLLGSCAAYKQNLMFVPGENFVPDAMQTNALRAERTYVIQKYDFLNLEIYSNNGEKLVDPNPELSPSQQGTATNQAKTEYLVDLNGVAKFPMIGELKVDGLTLRQAEQVIQKEYEKYFKTPFVILKYNNKRVIVLGSPGGQVIPLVNENMLLTEVIALAKGIDNDGKSHNIRVLRGEKVFIANLSTIDGYKKNNITIEPGDIIYIEPFRKPLAEGFRDYSIFLTLIVSITYLITIISRL